MHVRTQAFYVLRGKIAKISKLGKFCNEWLENPYSVKQH